MPITDALGIDEQRLPVVDAHTHTCGSDHDGPPQDVVACLDGCGVDGH